MVEAAAPDGYGLTTPDQLRVQAYAGAQINVAFGAAQGVQTVAPPPADSGDIVSPTRARRPTRRRAADCWATTPG